MFNQKKANYINKSNGTKLALVVFLLVSVSPILVGGQIYKNSNLDFNPQLGNKDITDLQKDFQPKIRDVNFSLTNNKIPLFSDMDSTIAEKSAHYSDEKAKAQITSHIEISYLIAEGNSEFDSLKDQYGFSGTGVEQNPFLISNFLLSSSFSFPLSLIDISYSIRISNLTIPSGGINLFNITGNIMIDNTVIERTSNLATNYGIRTTLLNGTLTIKNNQITLHSNGYSYGVYVESQINGSISILNNEFFLNKNEATDDHSSTYGIFIDQFSTNV